MGSYLKRLIWFDPLAVTSGRYPMPCGMAFSSFFFFLGWADPSVHCWECTRTWKQACESMWKETVTARQVMGETMAGRDQCDQGSLGKQREYENTVDRLRQGEF